jgi:hypothetical protein
VGRPGSGEQYKGDGDFGDLLQFGHQVFGKTIAVIVDADEGNGFFFEIIFQYFNSQSFYLLANLGLVQDFHAMDVENEYVSNSDQQDSWAKVDRARENY